MKTLRSLITAVALVALTACAQLGMQPADTFNKRVAAAYTTVQTVADAAAAGVKAGKISPADQANVVATARQSVAAITVAENIHSSNPQAGEDKLAATLAILTALQQYLATQGAK
jgi:hypothetical protein